MNCLTWLSGSPPVPTCSDDIQNQGWTGVDCGEPCPPCAAYRNAIWLEAEAAALSGNPTFATNSDGSAADGNYPWAYFTLWQTLRGPLRATQAVSTGSNRGPEPGNLWHSAIPVRLCFSVALCASPTRPALPPARDRSNA
jgi:hypothetical protein